VLFHIRMVDYPVSRRTAESREKHWRYLEERAAVILGRGPTQDDEGKVMRSSLFFIDVPDRAAAERFVAEEPHNQAGCFMNVEVLRWHNVLGRRQDDFARKDGQVYWYLRGYAKPGAHVKRTSLLEQHKAYFEPHDAERFILRGSVQTDDGQWVGSANLISLPDRKSADAFAAEEPFCKNGLFERIVIERYKIGGRPGQ
jgi:uncharacterized protein